jgi:predicted exporter
MRRSPLALLVLASWVAALGAVGWFVSRELEIGSDLRLFLPSASTEEQRLLLEEIGEGPASRILVIALEGAPPEQLADTSRALAEALRAGGEFRFVANGELSLDSLPDDLLPYRFLLSPSLDEHPLDAELLTAELRARSRDLASPAGLLLEPLLPRDPTLELLKLVELWQPLHEPRRELDVWFDRAGERALLIAETRAAAFDPGRQHASIESLERAFAALGERGDARMIVSGAGKFSEVIEERTRSEANSLGRAATIGMVVLLLLAFRGPGGFVLTLLPLGSAAVVGLGAVSALFGAVHGITLAFGFTLIGVAQDYPIHLLSHSRPGVSPRHVARSLWPTLATGIASTCVAYATFLLSGVLGLAQLAVFTVSGLAVAGLTTRFVLPVLIEARRDYGESPWLRRLSSAIARLPRPTWAGIALVAVGIAAIVLAPQPMWQTDLARLTPVPEDLLAQDRDLRAELGTADLRYLLAVRADDDEAALRRLEALDAPLRGLVQRGAIAGFDHAERYVPSGAQQRWRQSRLPDEATLRKMVEQAQAATAFRPGVFEPFIEDVARARELEPLTVAELRASAFGAQIDALLGASEGRTTALVTFNGVTDPAALQELARAAGPEATLLDLKAASDSLMAAQRTRMLWTLAGAAVLLVGVVAVALRDRRRVYRVIAPMAITTVVIVAVLQAAGVSLTLFHLISLILAAGLGLDYALFFEHAADDAAEQARTLHATLVCSLSTLLVFALLATSSLPVLRSIGTPVTIGVVSNFALALLLTRPAGGQAPRAASSRR